ncbi:3'-5'-exoribonuclease [Neopestalotiopsis sp. 37M]|nr:3'-5'-exoribonuclease [Neopestalotiopsis sp. 37M]
MADRRRINGPVGTTTPPVFVQAPSRPRPQESDSIRKIYLKTGSTPSASGSAYLELESRPGHPYKSNLKLSCTVHGPRALPRSAPFSPHIILTTHVKYAPFATRTRRGYLRDSSERDLGVHLETALRGAIIADRWPKSGVDIIVTIVEGDQDRDAPHNQDDENWEMMNVLSGCITVASAAIADAGIDCVDTVAGGVAALVSQKDGDVPSIIVDPLVAENQKIMAACCVAYLPSRDEVTNLWFKGQLPGGDFMVYNTMLERSMVASRSANRVIVQALSETVKKGQEAT